MTTVSRIFVVNVPILFSGCRNYPNRRKAGNVCQFPQAQAGTDRLPLMMARSVSLSSSCNSIRTHITQAKVFTHFSLLPHNMRGQCAWRGRGGEFSILTAWSTNLSFSLPILPQSLYTFLPDGNRKLWGRWVGSARMQRAFRGRFEI